MTPRREQTAETLEPRIAEAYAKINLGLRVLGRRPDGYHEIDTILQTVDLSDTLQFRPSRTGHLRVVCDDPGIPDGEENLVWKALNRLRTEVGRNNLGMEVEIKKGIPAGAGLGGGSSDAACALAAGSVLWGLALELRELESLAAEIGSDIPFFLRGGTCRAIGRGEILEPLHPNIDIECGLLLSPIHLATREVYGCFEPSLTRNSLSAKMVQQLIVTGDARELADLLNNDLEAAARTMAPKLLEYRDRLEELGYPIVRMTGSGSALFFWPAPKDRVQETRRAFMDSGCRIELVRATQKGWVWR
ncbi:MAG: 4-(cytidine 5'-diphospho)-2-C-methyl-D-erythritol kinase [Candidatus Eisenbacteria bacterium]|uniref:4-diphosphocytidyl-2-C-methyl-D-erythritol kinase n=1 Tax=Eiseniibacteriota bacterium TaxID=2212470 RepID=A0A948WB52_UNCEI|nr:4-(cytidine 5'-diphospho)-2-C-methyl-D-erythritol kinase [Candidatus Eisenbacteria bacterium]MBU1950653.1 4-(cytidine 5'-diphospho)-2-C-methyl-D-erythritol kinase [Candidatus Eisenbacteria bacterium]MBU2689648.1 4-(cytidine 5'-diphospho)-2-C-methyl-D-erythritol kinase [Candidatus Eisenbacteria bacterium]